MKAILKKKLVFLMLLGGVGHAMAHTASESNEVARTMLEVATIYNRYHGCKTGDVLINYGLPQVFFGQIDTGEGWTYEGRQAAFDQYVKYLADLDFSVPTNNVSAFANMAVAQCGCMHYTNAVSSIRRLVLNPTYPIALKYRAVRTAVNLSGVSDEATSFIESVITNSAGLGPSERGIACGLYAKKLCDLKEGGVNVSPEMGRAVFMLYQNRKHGELPTYVIDKLFASAISGYACSSNRLDMALFALSDPHVDNEDRLDFITITNQLLSCGQPLEWINVGDGDGN